MHNPAINIDNFQLFLRFNLRLWSHVVQVVGILPRFPSAESVSILVFGARRAVRTTRLVFTIIGVGPEAADADAFGRICL